MTKRLVSLFMTILMIVSVATVGVSQTAFAKTKKGVTEYKVTKVDKTKTYKNGMTAEVFYKKVNLKGSSKAIKKINKVYNKDCNKFLNGKSAKNLYKYAKTASKPSSGDPNKYSYTAKSKVKYNKNNIISTSVSTYWFAGFVVNTMKYGFTYNVKTGKKLTLKNVCKYSKKQLKNVINKKLKKKYGGSLYHDYQKYLKNVYKLPFYITDKNKCVIFFEPYSVKSGGSYTYVTVNSKYK